MQIRFAEEGEERMLRKLLATLALIAVMAAVPMISATSQGASAQDDEIRIAYILHGLNDFTQLVRTLA
jgi:ABC-type sugar transport system substrate-binding protein